MRVSQGRASAHPLLPPLPWRVEGWEVPCTAGGGWRVGVGMQYSKAILCSEERGLSKFPSGSQRPPSPTAATPLGYPPASHGCPRLGSARFRAEVGIEEALG